MTRKFKILKSPISPQVVGGVYETNETFGSSIGLLFEDKSDFWWYNYENLEEVFDNCADFTSEASLYTSVEHFINNIHPSTNSEVSLRPYLTVVYCNDVELICETPERAVEVMKALLVLFPKE